MKLLSRGALTMRWLDFLPDIGELRDVLAVALLSKATVFNGEFFDRIAMSMDSDTVDKCTVHDARTRFLYAPYWAVRLDRRGLYGWDGDGCELIDGEEPHEYDGFIGRWRTRMRLDHLLNTCPTTLRGAWLQAEGFSRWHVDAAYAVAADPRPGRQQVALAFRGDEGWYEHWPMFRDEWGVGELLAAAACGKFRELSEAVNYDCQDDF